MKKLNSKYLLMPLFLFMSSCQSTTDFIFRTLDEKEAGGRDLLHIIHVNSNRVQQKCLFLNAEAENNWRHQYLMYILNDKNQVVEIMQPTNQDKESCYSQLHQIERLLKLEQQISVCVRDQLKKSTLDADEKDHFVQFKSLGKHSVVYDSLTLDSICNSKRCFNNNNIWTNTCPGFTRQ